MGLRFLGRGKGCQAAKAGTLHVLGGACGGAAIGGILGLLGSLVSLSTWRLEIVGVIIIFALWHSLVRNPWKLGRRRQVPRRLESYLPTDLSYFAWGAMLGSGVVTLIPYSSLLVILGVELTSGVGLSCACGAAFGAAREFMILIPLYCNRREADPTKMIDLFSALATKVRLLNSLWVVSGGVVLLLATVR